MAVHLPYQQILASFIPGALSDVLLSNVAVFGHFLLAEYSASCWIKSRICTSYTFPSSAGTVGRFSTNDDAMYHRADEGFSSGAMTRLFIWKYRKLKGSLLSSDITKSFQVELPRKGQVWKELWTLIFRVIWSMTKSNGKDYQLAEKLKSRMRCLREVSSFGVLIDLLIRFSYSGVMT